MKAITKEESLLSDQQNSFQRNLEKQVLTIYFHNFKTRCPYHNKEDGQDVLTGLSEEKMRRNIAIRKRFI